MIGILALQGAFIEHMYLLEKINLKSILVKDVKDFDNIDSLIIGGGESTTMLKLLKSNNLLQRLNHFIHIEKKPTMGICAGLILLASPEINALNITIKRNFYGSQINSFFDINNFNNKNIKGVFIRAPKIMSIQKDVNILCKNSNNEITGVKQDNIIGFSFHPELTDETSIHLFFNNIK